MSEVYQRKNWEGCKKIKSVIDYQNGIGFYLNCLIEEECWL